MPLFTILYVRMLGNLALLCLAIAQPAGRFHDYMLAKARRKADEAIAICNKYSE